MNVARDFEIKRNGGEPPQDVPSNNDLGADSEFFGAGDNVAAQGDVNEEKRA